MHARTTACVHHIGIAYGVFIVLFARCLNENLKIQDTGALS